MTCLRTPSHKMTRILYQIQHFPRPIQYDDFATTILKLHIYSLYSNPIDHLTNQHAYVFGKTTETRILTSLITRKKMNTKI